MNWNWNNGPELPIMGQNIYSTSVSLTSDRELLHWQHFCEWQYLLNISLLFWQQEHCEKDMMDRWRDGAIQTDRTFHITALSQQKQQGTTFMPFRALYIMSLQSVNWGHNRSIRVKIGDFVSCVTQKFDGWLWKTLRHLFYAISSSCIISKPSVDSNWSYGPEIPQPLCSAQWRLTHYTGETINCVYVWKAHPVWTNLNPYVYQFYSSHTYEILPSTCYGMYTTGLLIYFACHTACLHGFFRNRKM